MGQRAVLVTGASSGIGRACALLLSSRGFTVFAGVRKQADADQFSHAAGGALFPVMLDITDEASVVAAADSVARRVADGDSFSLVNNAGITVAGPVELLATAAWRRQFDVNLFGQLAVTRSFLPLLRARSGRIIFMGSLFGRISLPFVAPYCAAKFALEAVADSLAIELRTWSIPVILLEPGNIATPIWSRTKESVVGSLDAAPPERLALYRGALESFERLTDRYAAAGIPPERVARWSVEPFLPRRPRRRYKVGWDSIINARLGPLLPARLRQAVLARMTLRR